MKRVIMRGMKNLEQIEVDPAAGFDDLVLGWSGSSLAAGFAILVAVARRR